MTKRLQEMTDRDWEYWVDRSSYSEDEKKFLERYRKHSKKNCVIDVYRSALKNVISQNGKEISDWEREREKFFEEVKKDFKSLSNSPRTRQDGLE